MIKQFILKTPKVGTIIHEDTKEKAWDVLMEIMKSTEDLSIFFELEEIEFKERETK